MTASVLALLSINGLLLVAVLVLLLRRKPQGDSHLLQQQLIEHRTRLDRLVAAQRDVPRVLADARTEQMASLSSQFAELARVVTIQLESAQHTADERMADTGTAVADVRERLGELAETTRRLETLSKGVADVQELLRVPQLRGAIGEVWLEQMLAQIFPDSLYEMQHTFPTGERVDAVLKLGGRLVPIDSKFPLDACQRMLSANGEDGGKDRRAFKRVVRARVDEIADKYILPGHGTFDFAMMYVPAERVYYEAVIRDEDLEADDSLLAYAMARRVIPVSPNTLYAYLVSVLHGLRGLNVEESAREILAGLTGIRQELDKFQHTHEVLGRHIANAARQYGDADALIGRLQERFRGIVQLPSAPGG